MFLADNVQSHYYKYGVRSHYSLHMRMVKQVIYYRIVLFFGFICTVCLGSTNKLCLGQRLKHVNPVEMT